jgi:phage-related protein
MGPIDWKPMPIIGKSVKEIRIRNNGQFRVVYLAEAKTAVHVLHAFQKKSRKTRKHDIDRAKLALRDALARQMK